MKNLIGIIFDGVGLTGGGVFGGVAHGFFLLQVAPFALATGADAVGTERRIGAV